MDNKSEFRTKAKLIRKTLDMKLISTLIIDKIINEPFFINAQNIMLFYPLPEETDLRKLTEIKNKNFFLPRINGNDLEVCPYKKYDELQKSAFNTLEPSTNTVNPDILDVVFVPALMVDKNNYRLGYGKGFYDRFLGTTKALSVVAISSNLIVENLAIENHDKKVDIVITD